MASAREYQASILQRLLLVQNASDELLEETPGVIDILKQMDDLADELEEVLG